MYICYCVILVALMLIDRAPAYEETLTFDDCYRSLDYVTEKKRYLVEWDGYRQDDSSCDLHFNGYDKSEVLDKYKTCIKIKTFDVQSNNVVLKYYSDDHVLMENLKGTYSATSPPPNEWCSEPKEYVDINLYIPNRQFGQKIVLEVYGVMTYDYSKVVTAIVAGVLGGLALIAITVTITICVLARRKQHGSAGIVLSNGTGANQMLPQSTGQQMGGGNYATTSSNPSAPPPNYYSATTG